MKRLERGRLLSRDELYEGKIVSLTVDKIEIKGREAIREVVRHPGGVVVLALLEDGSIPFVRQHRYPIGEAVLELPAGKVDKGEPPLDSARRELEEETGYRALEIDLVCSFYTSPGFCDELLHFYFSNTLEKTVQNPEHDEELLLEFYTLEEALEMVRRGEIVDGKTITALYWLHCRQTAGERA